MKDTSGGRALIYARISQDREGAGLGVDRQEADCRTLAERLGLTVVEVFTDNDISAYSGKPRPGYKRLLDALEAGHADTVLAWHTDRLHRSPAELEDYISVCQPRNVATHTVKAGHLDLSTPSGRMVARQLGAVARFESEHKGDRVRAARQQAAQEGRWGGGGRPFGFEADGITIRPTEAAEIIRATDAILAGATLRSVTLDINTRGVTTTLKAQAWSPRTIKDVLLRPRNAGLSVYQGEITGPAAWPPIVPEDRWRALVQLLTDKSRRTSPDQLGIRWFGSGLFMCGVCGKPELRVSKSSNGVPVYRCRSRDWVPGGSGHVSRRAEALDDYVGKVLIERLRQDDATQLLRPARAGVDTSALHTEAVELRERLDQLALAHADGDIILSQLTAGSKRLRSRLGEIEVELAAAATGDPLAGIVGIPDPGAVWAGLDIGRRRAILDVLATVTVLPASRRRGPNGERFDPHTIRIDWKQ